MQIKQEEDAHVPAFTYTNSVSVSVTANKPSSLLFRLLLNRQQKPSWPLLGGCTVLVRKHQGDGSETKQSSIINGDIFHLTGEGKHTL